MVGELWSYLGQMQGSIMRMLAAELRAGGIGTVALAFGLGALHALTPGHGKSALIAYFLGKSAPIGKGIRVALSAAALHVFSGMIAFIVLRFVLVQAPSITGRGSPTFTIIGYAMVVCAGLMMIAQSLRPAHDGHDGVHALTLGMGLLPCPLTISVLGFAWLQSTALMVGVVLISLAIGIATTMGTVAISAIAAHRMFGDGLVASVPTLERYATRLQTMAGSIIVAIGLWMIWRSM